MTLASTIAGKYPGYVAQGKAGPDYFRNAAFVARNDERGPVDDRPRWVGTRADGSVGIVFVEPIAALG